MAIAFNLLMVPGFEEVRGYQSRGLAQERISGLQAGTRLVFMSHKTGDRSAEAEARYIMVTHRVAVYLAEWDSNVAGDAPSLPDYIMNAIRRSQGFLVNVIGSIGSSMWVGYEIGGAHAVEKPRARIDYQNVTGLPSVVLALARLSSRARLDAWIRGNVLL